MLDNIARHWWALVLRGALAVLFALLTFIHPGSTIVVLTFFIGAYLLVDGAVALFAAFRFGHQDNRWWVLLIEGIVGVAAGLLTFDHPLVTAVALVYLIAFWAIITGVLELIAAYKLRALVANELLLGITGIVSIVLGIFFLAAPETALVTGAYFIGAYALIFGVLLIVLGIRLRSYTPANGQVA